VLGRGETGHPAALGALAARRARGYGNPGVACELEVRSSLGFGALTLFVHVEAL
jgi:hypothetical protein